MNIPQSETPASAAPQDEVKQMREVLLHLRKQVQAGLAAAILLALGVNYFLFKEQSMVQQQLLELNQVMRAENEYLSKSVPQMNDLLGKLREYAKNHPDFRPILEKHFPSATNPASSPAVAPVKKDKTE